MTTEKVQLNSDLEVAHPCSGSSFTIPGRIGIWNLKIIMLSFEERGEPEYPEKKLLGAKERTVLQSCSLLTADVSPRR